MTAYYNENDKKAAQWLRNLIAAGHIAPGDVDDRSIEDVKPSDLIGYTQCHFFAGIGIWSDSLRRAGWSDERPVWTGSCPCQPFSAAGKGLGVADERHLWPAWEWLIRHAKPRSVPIFGEQVASKDGLAWLDVVQADLEGQDYTVRALDLCAAGVGAPHIRQRLYFVADTDEGRSGRHAGAVPSAQGSTGREVRRLVDGVEPSCAVGIVADAERDPRDARRPAVESAEGTRAPGAGPSTELGRRSVSGLMGYADDAGSQGRGVSGADRERERGDQRPARATGAADDQLADAGREGRQQVGANAGGSGEGSTASRLEQRLEHCGPVNGYWRDVEWLACIDGKARPVEPGTFPLAHGAESRVVRLRAYGNAIVAPLAEEFIRAYLG